jgi:hypothetical protein
MVRISLTTARSTRSSWTALCFVRESVLPATSAADTRLGAQLLVTVAHLIDIQVLNADKRLLAVVDQRILAHQHDCVVWLLNEAICVRDYLSKIAYAPE